jgi:predicted MFS family arabinose efflux permease
MAEVLRDNANQTIVPNIVRPEQLERANGRIWGVEAVTNTFAGPPLGSILLVVAFSLPFFVHASTFFVAAAMVALIPGTFRAKRDPNRSKQTFRQELGEGVRWLMGHTLLRPMAIILGLMNGAGMIAFATFVLFAQEVMEVGPFLFTVIGFGGAVGGFVGGNVAPRVTRRVGSGPALAISIAGLAVVPFLVGLIAWWPAVLVLFGFEAFFGILWNVITVSLRQTIIPEDLLGRVNSVYRFFAWGMIPIGSAIGGVWVWAMERQVGREFALRSTWFLVGAIHVALFLFGRAKLTTERIEAARSAATAPSAS